VKLQSQRQPITKFPKTNLDLPFFILTESHKDTTEIIKIHTADDHGRPFIWEVYHNKAIGIPKEAAHRVNRLLTQPAINETRDERNRPAEIVPIGGIRESLRKVGLQAGGRQGRWLIQLLDEVGSSRCVADFWINTEQKDENGKFVYVHFEGRFARFTIYRIGERHITEEELAKLNELNFDLDDVIYLRLEPLERTLQQIQGHRYTDNDLMDIVRPPTQRWLEICGGKMYGTVKHKKGSYFDWLYSDYVLHHPPLKRHYEHKRVTEQINRIVKDLVEKKVLSKYPAITKIVEPEKEIDFNLRFYVGEGAEESVARVLGHLSKGRKQKSDVNKNELNNSPQKIQEAAPEQGSEAPTPTTTDLLPIITAEDDDLLQQLVVNFGIDAIRAFELLKNHREAVKLQLEAWPYRKVNIKQGRAAWMIRAIERNYEMPPDYQQVKQKEADRQRLIAEHERVTACPFCRDMNGWRKIITDHYPDGAMRKCSHDPAKENQLKSAT